MKKLIFSMLLMAIVGVGYAQTTAEETKKQCAEKVQQLKEKLQLTPEQSTKVDSILAKHEATAAKATDAAAKEECKKAQDAEIVALLTPEQQDKYTALKAECKKGKEATADAATGATAEDKK